MERASSSPPGDSFYPATVLTGMTDAMEAYREEIFGPLLGIYRFQTESEVVDMANNTPVGLAAYVYTNSLPVAWRVAESLEGEDKPFPWTRHVPN